MNALVSKRPLPLGRQGISLQILEASAFERLSGGRSRGQEDPRSQFRKGVVGDWKDHLDAACHAAFNPHGAGLLREWGYEPAGGT